MRTMLSLGVLVLILEISTAQVLELNDATFLETVTGHPITLVEFYSPTCPFCQKIAPVYEGAAKLLHDSQPEVQVAKVDCTNAASNITCTKSSVRYVPMIVLFQNGANVKSFGDRKRDEETIVKFVTEAANDTNLPAKQQDDITVPKTPPINACDEMPPQSVAAPTTISEGLPVTELNDATFANFLKSSPYVIVDYYAPWCSDCQRLSPLFDEAALQLQKTNLKIKFAKVDCNKGNVPTSTICQAVQLKFFPWVVLYHDGQTVSHYSQENVPDTATIYNFINSGTKSNDETQVVQELDDSSFDSVVSSHPYVLVDFFAPWCFYCKKMAPIYDEVATEIQTSLPSVRLVKVDCTATNTKTKQTCTKNDIAFLPTLKLFQNGKVAKEYEGDKTSKGPILSFINEAVGSEQSSKRHSMNSSSKNDTNEKHEKNDQTNKHDKKSKDEDEEGSSSDKELEDKDDDQEEKYPHKKKKASKETKTKKTIAVKKSHKENARMDRAARILKKVFKQFKHNKLAKKTKLKKYDDDDDDESDSSSNQWQQVVKDIHQVAKDIHKMSKEFHKSVSNKQPAVDRLVKVFSHLVKTKDEDEDDF